MCGISGVVHKNSQHISSSDSHKLLSSLDLLKSRGPDAQASCQGDHWIIGHTRLSIIDLSGGVQPMQDSSTGVTLSYNGEIYNYKSLRKELESKGHVFKSDSDTEVLLRSYLQWGIDCTAKIFGCFAFAVMDPTKNKLILVRDRLGVKPLYYLHKNGTFYFASSVAAVKNMGEVSEVDYTAVSHYLTSCRITFGEKTLFKGIKTLPPGTTLVVDLVTHHSSFNKYWSRPMLKAEDKKDLPANDLLQNTRELVETSVKDRLISDVPVGCFLSGGLDSAVVVKEAVKNALEDYPLYCAGTPFEKYNEFQYAAEMAGAVGKEVEEVRISPQTFFEDWKMLIAQKGLPLSTPNETSIYRLAKALGEKCKVALTGEGSDEVFGGYLLPQFGVNDFLRAPKSEEETDNPLYWKLMRRFGRPFFYNEADHFFLTGSWMPMSDKAALFTEDIWNSLEDDDEVFTFYEDFFEKYKDLSAFDRRMHLHAEVNLEGLLNRVDSSTMAASIEARVPFTDHRIVEFAFKQSDNWKMDYRNEECSSKAEKLLVEEIEKENLLETKRLLRNAYRKDLPTSIIDRKKMSFPVPFQEWLSGDLSSELKEFCIETSRAHQLFNPQIVEQMFESGNRNIWLVANLCLWLES